MSKITLAQYRQQIKQLRKARQGFTAQDGYKLTGSLTRGQKAAITRAFKVAEDFEDEEGEGIYYDAPDEDEVEWDDIDYIDFDEAYEDFGDEESDNYSENEK